MSAAAAAAPTLDAGTPAPAPKGKKKLLIIVVAVLVLLLLAGGATVVLLKRKAAHAAAEGENAAQVDTRQPAKPDLKHPPTFLPLEPFVVNLADRDADRYAQIGITLEIEDAKFADEIKAFMPAIRNTILLILSHKSSRELLDLPGKIALAEEVRRESARTMGIDVGDPPAPKPAAGEADAAAPKPAPRRVAAEPNPIRRVHFSNFIVQ